MTVTTKSGDNRFHGDGFRFLCITKLDARNCFLPGRAEFGQNQFGGALGSPVFGNIVSAQAPRIAHLGIKFLV